MTAVELCQSHLLREARVRVLHACNESGMTPYETSKALMLAHEQMAPLDRTLSTLEKSIGLCELVLEKHAAGSPGELLVELRLRAAWKREVLALLREERST